MSEGIPALEFNEEVEGIVQCHHCNYWGKMLGYLEFNDPKFIKFVCPECQAIERVVNPEAL